MQPFAEIHQQIKNNCGADRLQCNERISTYYLLNVTLGSLINFINYKEQVRIQRRERGIHCCSLSSG